MSISTQSKICIRGLKSKGVQNTKLSQALMRLHTVGGRWRLVSYELQLFSKHLTEARHEQLFIGDLDLACTCSHGLPNCYKQNKSQPASLSTLELDDAPISHRHFVLRIRKLCHARCLTLMTFKSLLLQVFKANSVLFAFFYYLNYQNKSARGPNIALTVPKWPNQL